MAKREKKHPTKTKGGKALIVGAEIDSTDSWDLIKGHAVKQLEGKEEIGTILVHIQTPAKKDSRLLVYTALGKNADGDPRGYKVASKIENKTIDKVEKITGLHSNPWHWEHNGVVYLIC